MENGEKSRRLWLLAVIVSVALHASVLSGLAMLAGRADVKARTAEQPRLMPYAFVDGGGEVTFEEPRPAKNSASSPQKKTIVKPPDAAAVTAQLRDPWSAAATNDGSAESSEADGDSPKAKGADASVSFFNIEARASRIVFVVDVSSSMGIHGALAAARRELTAALRKLSGGTRFQIILYNSHATYLLPRFAGWLEPTAAITDEACAALARQVAEGSTDHEPALRMALNLRPDVIFFLTDADDLRPEQVRRISLLNHEHAVIHTIALATGNRAPTWMSLQELARENGGTYRAVDLASPLLSSY